MQHRRLLAALLLTLAGCASNGLDAIDREVTQVLRQQHRDTLGPYAPIDAALAPSRDADPRPASRAYDRSPPTNNPSAANLPARAAGPGDLPEVDASNEPMLTFGLTESLLYAVEHSREYRSRKEDLFVAVISLLIEKHLWGPRFFNDVTASFTGTPEAGDHAHAFSLINDLRVTQRLPSGGEVSVGAVVSFVEQLRAAAGSTADDAQSADLRMSASIPLLRGAGKVAQEDLTQAYRDLVYATREFEQFRQQFLVEVSTAYFTLIQLQGSIENVQKQLASFEGLAKRTAALADSGRQPFFEVQRAQQQVLSARNNLLSTRERYQNRLDAFKINLGMPTTQKLTLVPIQIEVPIPVLKMDESTRTAWDLRLDLQTSQDQIDDARRRVEVAKNKMQADLNLFADVTLPTDPNKKRAGVDLDPGHGRYNAGVTLGVPLDRRIEALQHRTSLINLERAQRAYTQLRDTLALGVRDAIRNIELAQATLALQTVNVELADRRITEVQLRERTLGPRDLIEAEDELLEAKDRLDQASRDLRVNVLNYLLATGQMRVSSTGQWQAPAKLTVMK
jgi:outer membrane protein TolC